MPHVAAAGEGNVNGFGLEFYIETPADEVADTIHDIKKSWQFQLLYTVSQLAAGARQSASVAPNGSDRQAMPVMPARATAMQPSTHSSWL